MKKFNESNLAKTVTFAATIMGIFLIFIRIDDSEKLVLSSRLMLLVVLTTCLISLFMVLFFEMDPLKRKQIKWSLLPIILLVLLLCASLIYRFPLNQNDRDNIVIAGQIIPIDKQELNLQNCGINDIGELSRMTKLTTLSLRSNQITDIDGLKSLTKLEMLSLRFNQVSSIDALSELTHLRKLYLDGNQITDIRTLANLKNLVELDISNNLISDISVLGELTNLEVLYLNNNRISNIDVLSNLKHLTKLVLSDNSLTEEQISVLQDSLPGCDIITDIVR